MGNVRGSLSPKTRFEVLKRDGFKCQYCGRPAPDVILEIDHIVPVSSGGKTEIPNLITACKACNRGKGKRSLNHPEAYPLIDMDKMTKEAEELIERAHRELEHFNSLASKIDEWLIFATGRGMTDVQRRCVVRDLRIDGFDKVFTKIADNFAEISGNDDEQWDSTFEFAINWDWRKMKWK